MAGLLQAFPHPCGARPALSCRSKSCAAVTARRAATEFAGKRDAGIARRSCRDAVRAMRARAPCAGGGLIGAGAAPACVPALLPGRAGGPCSIARRAADYDPFGPTEIPQWRRQWRALAGGARPARRPRTVVGLKREPVARRLRRSARMRSTSAALRVSLAISGVDQVDLVHGDELQDFAADPRRSARARQRLDDLQVLGRLAIRRPAGDERSRKRARPSRRASTNA